MTIWEDSRQVQDCPHLLTMPPGCTQSANAYIFQPTAPAASEPMPNTVFQPGAFRHTQNCSVANFTLPPTLNLKPRDAVIDACRVALLQFLRNTRLLKLLGKKFLSVARYPSLICFLSTFCVLCDVSEHSWVGKVFYTLSSCTFLEFKKASLGTGPSWLFLFLLKEQGLSLITDLYPCNVLRHWIKWGNCFLAWFVLVEENKQSTLSVC